MVNPNMSGGDRVCAIYAQKLAYLGHEVNIVAPKKKYLGYKQQLKRLLKGQLWVSKKEQAKNHFEIMSIDVVSADAYAPLTDKSVPDADVVIATWWETAEWVNSFSEKKGKKVYFVQGHEVYEFLPKERVRATYRLPFCKITIANWLVSIMELEYSSKPPYLVPNSVDHDLFYAERRAKQNIPTIGFLFSESEFKGVEVALEVIQGLKAKMANLRVIAFGVCAPNNINLPDYIELSINPEQEKIRGIYQQCDLWLCCSLIEGFGLTILEAMACRIPAVSTKCGGPEDIINQGDNGYLCNINDVSALTDASYKILHLSDDEWMGFSDRAYGFASGYSWDDAAKLFEASLQRILLES